MVKLIVLPQSSVVIRNSTKMGPLMQVAWVEKFLCVKLNLFSFYIWRLFLKHLLVPACGGSRYDFVNQVN